MDSEVFMVDKRISVAAFFIDSGYRVWRYAKRNTPFTLCADKTDTTSGSVITEETNTVGCIKRKNAAMTRALHFLFIITLKSTKAFLKRFVVSSYWDFSIDEFARFDIPAFVKVDYEQKKKISCL